MSEIGLASAHSYFYRSLVFYLIFFSFEQFFWPPVTLSYPTCWPPAVLLSYVTNHQKKGFISLSNTLAPLLASFCISLEIIFVPPISLWKSPNFPANFPKRADSHSMDYNATPYPFVKWWLYIPNALNWILLLLTCIPENLGCFLLVVWKHKFETRKFNENMSCISCFLICVC